MAASVSDLVDFLLARIAEDEAVARKASVGSPQWHQTAGDRIAPHVARWDPARVLAECEAKRRVVERETRSQTPITYRRQFVLRDLASVYADHPDYDPAWRV